MATLTINQLVDQTEMDLKSHTLLGPTCTATRSNNRWTAPDSAGSAVLWVVLRDNRWGAAFIEQHIEVF